MKTPLLTLFLLLSIGSKAQFNHIEYKQECDVAYRLAIDSAQYKKSLKKLTSVKKKYGKLYCEEYVLSAFCYKQMQKNTKSAKSLKSAWSTYVFDFNCLFQMDEIQPGKVMEGFTEKQKQIVEQGFAKSAGLKNKVTDSLIAVFDAMLERDIAPRIKPRLNAHDSLVVGAEIRATDSINLIEFKRIIKTYGYPGEWLLPLRSNVSFFILVHSAYDQNFYNEMNEVFRNEVVQGRMAPSFYLLWLDKHNSFLGLPTEYAMLKLPKKKEFTPSEIKLIIEKRLIYGLIKNCPIPSKQLNFQ